MRFRHLSLDEQLKQTEKTDEKTVAKAQLLKSKEWQDHVSEHHGTGPKAQLVEVKAAEDSELLQKANEKKDTTAEKKEDQAQLNQQHTVEHGQATSGSKTGYLSGAGGGTAQRGAGDEYFGAGSARLKEISGQCSCGMEVSTGWQPEQQKAPTLSGGYTASLFERDNKQQESGQLLYTTATGQQGTQQERPLYSTNLSNPLLGTSSDQKRRRTGSL